MAEPSRVRHVIGELFESAPGYHLRVLRREQLVVPAGLWGLFAFMAWLFRNQPRRSYGVAAAFLGIVLPLIAGVLAAPALVDDPAIELQLTAPRRPWRTLLERLLVLLAVVGVAALTFQCAAAALGVPLGRLGGPLARQLVWVAPSVALMALSSVVALGLRYSLAGTLLVGLTWIVQLIFDTRVGDSPWARYVYLFMGARQPEHPELRLNQTALVALAILLVAVASLMLRREERLL